MQSEDIEGLKEETNQIFILQSPILECNGNNGLGGGGLKDSVGELVRGL